MVVSTCEETSFFGTDHDEDEFLRHKSGREFVLVAVRVKFAIVVGVE